MIRTLLVVALALPAVRLSAQNLAASATASPPEAPAAGDSAAALRQARGELKALRRQLGLAETAGDGDAVDSRSRSGAHEASAPRAESVSALKGRIAAKKKEVDKAREAELRRYRTLRVELGDLERKRNAAKAAAYGATAPTDEVSVINGRIRAKRREIALVLRDNPGFAAVWAPLVVVHNLLFPRRPADDVSTR